MSLGSRHLPTLPGRVMLQWWGKIRPISCCENSRRRWWELSSPLSLLRSFTQPYLGNSHKPRERPATCLPNEYKTKPLTDRWVTEVKCVHLLVLLFLFPPCSLVCFLLIFFPLHGIQLYISPSWHHSKKREWDERNKTEPKCGNFSSCLYSHLSGFIVNPVCVNQSAPGAKPHTSTLH